MSLEKVFETPVGVTPSLITFRNKPGQLFIQFTEDGKSINDFTVDEILLKENDLHSVHDYEKNEDKRPSNEQIKAFNIVREWLLSQNI